MPIEITCRTCACRLRVGDEHVGRQARCPQCGSVYRVPERSEPVSSADQETVHQLDPARPVWQLRTPDGRLFGPVSKPTLDQWVLEGRVPGGASIGRCDTGGWYSAVEHYPQLAPPGPLRDSVGGEAIPSGRLEVPAPTPRLPRPALPLAYRLRHRGALVLTLGILGWLTCPLFSVLASLFSVLACLMGWIDLRAMRNGTMDPAGQSLTQAGLVLGLIQIVVVLVFALAAFLLGVLV